jgi:hypothetical protein
LITPSRTTSKLERIKEYQDVAKLPDLTDDEIREITEAGYKLHHRAFVRKTPKNVGSLANISRTVQVQQMDGP